MEENDISKMEGQGTMQSPPSSVVAIAISGNKNSKYVVKWALDKFVPEGETRFMLLHVRPEITAVPTPSKFFGLFLVCSSIKKSNSLKLAYDGSSRGIN